jgi:hypothetical protein
MEGTHRELDQRPVSVLVATTILSGCQAQYFKSEIGLEYGVRHHELRSSGNSLSGEDERRLFEVITKRAESEPNFWSEHIERATSAGSRLMNTIRSSLPVGEQPSTRQELLARFLAVKEVMEQMAPFVVATPVMVEVLTSLLGNRLAQEAGELNPDTMVPAILPRVLTSWQEPDPVGDMRNAYRSR